MLIRHAVLLQNGIPQETELRLMHGVVQEIGCGLVKGLYESEIDMQGDVLRPGLVIARAQVTAEELRRLYRQGVALVATQSPVQGRLITRSARVIVCPDEKLACLPAEPSPAVGLPDWPELVPYRMICPGSPAPLTRWTQAGDFVGVIDAHTGD